jgi:hypothetical protein
MLMTPLHFLLQEKKVRKNSLIQFGLILVAETGKNYFKRAFLFFFHFRYILSEGTLISWSLLAFNKNGKIVSKLVSVINWSLSTNQIPFTNLKPASYQFKASFFFFFFFFLLPSYRFNDTTGCHEAIRFGLLFYVGSFTQV